MKRHALLILFSFYSFFTIAQVYPPSPAKIKKEACEALKKTTLLVVLTDEQSSESQTIIAGFDKYWKYNKYEFITTHDVDKYKENALYSYFSFQNQSFEINLFKTKYYGLSDETFPLVTSFYLTGMPEPADHKEGEIPYDFEFAFPHILVAMQKEIDDQLAMKKVLTTYRKGVTYYEGAKEILDKKIVLIWNELSRKAGCSDSIAKKGVSLFLNKSQDSIFIVSKEQIQKAIEEKDDNIAISYTPSLILAMDGTKLAIAGYFHKSQYTKKDLRKRRLIMYVSLTASLALCALLAVVVFSV